MDAEALGLASKSGWPQRIAMSKDYDMLQGLVSIGVGLALIALALTENLIWLAVGCGISAAVGVSWYQKRYGTAHATDARNVWAAAFATLGFLSVSIASSIDHSRPGPLLWTPLIAGAMLLAGEWAGLRHAGLTIWHWLSCLALMLCTFLPLAGWHPPRFQVIALIGPALIVIGVVDHLRLVKTLGNEGQR